MIDYVTITTEDTSRLITVAGGEHQSVKIAMTDGATVTVRGDGGIGLADGRTITIAANGEIRVKDPSPPAATSGKYDITVRPGSRGVQVGSNSVQVNTFSKDEA